VRGNERQLHAPNVLFCFKRRGAPPGAELSWGRGWGLFRSEAKKISTSDLWLRLIGESPWATSHQRSRTSLIQPCGLERLVGFSPLATDGLGDLSGAHFLPCAATRCVRDQSDRARSAARRHQLEGTPLPAERADSERRRPKRSTPGRPRPLSQPTPPPLRLPGVASGSLVSTVREFVPMLL
jgi:hypothetical protein